MDCQEDQDYYGCRYKDSFQCFHIIHEGGNVIIRQDLGDKYSLVVPFADFKKAESNNGVGDQVILRGKAFHLVFKGLPLEIDSHAITKVHLKVN